MNPPQTGNDRFTMQDVFAIDDHGELEEVLRHIFLDEACPPQLQLSPDHQYYKPVQAIMKRIKTNPEFARSAEGLRNLKILACPT